MSGTIRSSEVRDLRATEQYPIVDEQISQNQHENVLKEKEPLTYTISRISDDTFLFSFIEENRKVSHRNFQLLQNGELFFRNGADNVYPTISQLIRGIMHLKDSSRELH